MDYTTYAPRDNPPSNRKMKYDSNAGGKSKGSIIFGLLYIVLVGLPTRIFFKWMIAVKVYQ
jgi:hypothetical protein